MITIMINEENKRKLKDVGNRIIGITELLHQFISL